MPNILIMPTPLRHRPGRFRSILESAGFAAIDPPGTARLTPNDLKATLPDSDALLAWGAPITAAMMASAPRLRVVARAGSGHDAVDLAAATERRIAVTTTPGANAESVAEHVFALLLGLTRRVILNDESVRAGAWDRRPVRSLRGMTLGIVGLGRCGSAVAHRALAFGMRVVAWSRRPRSRSDIDPGIARVSLVKLLDESDVVSPHLPLTSATRGLFDSRAFGLMRAGSLFINTSRGGLVVEDDLIESLASGHLAGAGLDVLDNEPPDTDNRLLRLSNVILSPHIGGIDAASLDDMAEQAAQCVITLLRGDWPDGYAVNDELRHGWRW
jgi:phosphoglycerate dehydrogenase-like enzyme